MKKSFLCSQSLVKFGVLSTIAVLIVFFPLFTFFSCSLEQGSGHTVRIPLFYNTTDKSLSTASATDNDIDPSYSHAIPPIIGWEETTLNADTIEFAILDTSLTCEVNYYNDHVTFAGSNESVHLTFTVYEDDNRFSYTGIVLEETDSGWIMVESNLEDGEIRGDYLIGESGTGKVFEVVVDSDTIKLLSFTYDVSTTNESLPTIQINEVAQKSEKVPPPFDTSWNTWEEKRAAIDELTPEPLTNVVTYTLHSNGEWVPREKTE